MSNEFAELSMYRLDRAKEDLANAKEILNNKFLKGAINRAYYAIFQVLEQFLF